MHNLFKRHISQKSESELCADFGACLAFIKHTIKPLKCSKQSIGMSSYAVEETLIFHCIPDVCELGMNVNRTPWIILFARHSEYRIIVFARKNVQQKQNH